MKAILVRLTEAALLAALAGSPGCTRVQPFEFVTFELANGSLGQAYADTIRTAGAHGTVTMKVMCGQLPPGIGLRVSHHDGVLYGQPTRAGDFSFTVEARDSCPDQNPDIITQGFAITVDSL